MRAAGSSPRRADEDGGFARSEPVREEAWFATLGFGAERTQPMDLARGETVPPGAPPGTASPDGPARRAPAPPPELPPAPRRHSRIEPPASFQRIFRAFTIARALLGLLLLGIQGLVVVYLGGKPVWSSLLVCGAQVLAALAMLAWPVPPAGYMPRPATCAAAGRWRPSAWPLAWCCCCWPPPGGGR